MITLYRKIKLRVLKTKWELALFQFIDKQIMELIKDPDELAKKFMPYLTEMIYKSGKINN